VGKEPKQSFVYPRFEADGENAYHVHLLHEPADGTVLKVKNFLLTARKSANHWDPTKGTWQDPPTGQQRDDLPRLWAMLETLKRSGSPCREEVPNDTEVGDPLVQQWTADLNLSRDQLQAFLGEIGVPTEELESWTLSDFSAAFAEELQRVRAPQAKKDPPKKKEPRKKVSKIPQEKK
jgi:hypothetical protein